MNSVVHSNDYGIVYARVHHFNNRNISYVFYLLSNNSSPIETIKLK